MAIGRAMISSTFRPQLDRCISRDGTTVVLWSDTDEIVTLRFADERWIVSRHGAVMDETDSVRWRGSLYCADAEPICEFEEWTPDSEWSAFYEQWPLRAGLGGTRQGDAIGAA